MKLNLLNIITFDNTRKNIQDVLYRRFDVDKPENLNTKSFNSGLILIHITVMR